MDHPDLQYIYVLATPARIPCAMYCSYPPKIVLQPLSEASLDTTVLRDEMIAMGWFGVFYNTANGQFNKTNLNCLIILY